MLKLAAICGVGLLVFQVSFAGTDPGAFEQVVENGSVVSLAPICSFNSLGYYQCSNDGVTRYGSFGACILDCR